MPALYPRSLLLSSGPSARDTTGRSSPECATGAPLGSSERRSLRDQGDRADPTPALLWCRPMRSDSMGGRIASGVCPMLLLAAASKSQDGPRRFERPGPSDLDGGPEGGAHPCRDQAAVLLEHVRVGVERDGAPRRPRRGAQIVQGGQLAASWLFEPRPLVRATRYPQTEPDDWNRVMGEIALQARLLEG